MAHLFVVDGGDNLQIWRVTANIQKKQSRTTHMLWCPSLGTGSGNNNTSAWNTSLPWRVTHGLERDLVNTVMHLQVPQRVETFRLA